MEVGLCPDHIVLDGDPAPPLPKRGTAAAPRFGTRPLCGQMAGWIKMPFGTEVGLGPGHIVLDGGWSWLPNLLCPSKKGHSRPHFSAHDYCGQSFTHLSNCWALVSILVKCFTLNCPRYFGSVCGNCCFFYILCCSMIVCTITETESHFCYWWCLYYYQHFALYYSMKGLILGLRPV